MGCGPSPPLAGVDHALMKWIASLRAAPRHRPRILCTSLPALVRPVCALPSSRSPLLLQGRMRSRRHPLRVRLLTSTVWFESGGAASKPSSTCLDDGVVRRQPGRNSPASPIRLPPFSAPLSTLTVYIDVPRAARSPSPFAWIPAPCLSSVDAAVTRLGDAANSSPSSTLTVRIDGGRARILRCQCARSAPFRRLPA